MEGSGQAGSQTPAKDAAARAQQPAPASGGKAKTVYEIYVTPNQLVAAYDREGASDGDKEFAAKVKGLDSRTLMYAGQAHGYDREQACGALLDEGKTPCAQALAALSDSGQNITLLPVAASAIGSVPVQTEVKTQRKIGGR